MRGANVFSCPARRQRALRAGALDVCDRFCAVRERVADLRYHEDGQGFGTCACCCRRIHLLDADAVGFLREIRCKWICQVRSIIRRSEICYCSLDGARSVGKYRRNPDGKPLTFKQHFLPIPPRNFYDRLAQGRIQPAL